MDDPFGLLEIAAQPREGKHKTLPRKAYLTVISVLVVFILVLVTFFIFQGSNKATADIDVPSATIKITNLPNEVKTGETISFNLVFTNKGNNFSDSYALIQGEGLNLNPTIKQAQDIKSGEAGYVRKINEEESSVFDQKGDSGIRFEVGNLTANQSKTLTLTAVITSGSEVPAKLETKLFKPILTSTMCGFLGLKKCTQSTGNSQIASGVFQIEPAESGKIKLRPGFNFVSLPYLFTQGALSEFFSSLKTKWAYVYDPTTASYLDLNSADNVSKIKPGVAFWLYDKEGGEYALPNSRVETNPNETISIPLAIGWNQIGNPYSKRMILSGTKILVRELSDTGSETGTSYDLKTAISNATLSDPYFIAYSSSGSSSVSTVKALLGSTLEPFSGFLIKAEKKVSLIIPGKEVITPGDNLSAEERSKIETWISDTGLNQFGDPAGTVYSGGTPLFDEATGQTIDRFDYILKRHPDRPWNK